VIADIVTIIWKEFRELFHQRGLRGAIFNWAIMVALGGLFMPLQNGLAWLTMPILHIAWSWIALLAVMQIVSDTFAGERERHTLETLLASRLSDRAILLGKVASVVLYGWSIQIAGLVLGWLAVNIEQWSGVVHFYAVDILFGVAPITALLVVLVASLGTLVSLHSTTVRSAYQKMSLVFLAFVFVPAIAIQFIPQVGQALVQLDYFKPTLATYWAVALGITALSAVALAVGADRFKRSKLMEEM
jgi:ABC-2 type transport system permease protein